MQLYAIAILYERLEQQMKIRAVALKRTKDEGISGTDLVVLGFVKLFRLDSRAAAKSEVSSIRYNVAG